jgi:hypothetical protein
VAFWTLFAVSVGAFSGAVPEEAARVEKTVVLTQDRWGWHSTGLYVLPGEEVAVESPQGIEQYKLKLRIGCHKDKLRKEPFKRPQQITVSAPLTSGTSIHKNQYGGPVYIEVPKGIDAPALSFKISGAVEAPHYIHGKTTSSEWNTIRSHPAPWAELESDRVVLSVPSEHIRALDNPSALMDFWNEVLDAQAELAAIPKERSRPERIVPDVQITAGFMHSGYPVMIHLPQAKRLVQLDELRSNKGGKNWGYFHEFGHNHQSRQWTYQGTGEVTCNLFSLYTIEKACSGSNPHRAMDPKKRKARLEQYLANGADFEVWKKDPFLALTMYVQLQEAFGWQPFMELFADYRKDPIPNEKGKRRPSDGQVRDEWMVRYSNHVGRNLGPFFEHWGVPVSGTARESVAHLPRWMPAKMQ